MDGVEPLTAGPARRTRERSPAVVRAALFSLADMAAVTVAWLGAGPALHLAVPELTGASDPIGAASLLWLGSAIGVVLWLASRRHHYLRLAWSTQLSDVLAGSAVALAGTASATALAKSLGYVDIAQSTGGDVVSSSWLALWLLGWMLFAPSLMVTRSIARTLLRSSGRWTLRTVIVAPSAAAEKVEAALRSSQRLGFEVIGRLDPADPRQAAELRHIGAAQADLLVMAADLEGASTIELMIAEFGPPRLPIATTLVHPGLSSLDSRHRAFAGHDVVLLPPPRGLAMPVGGMRKRCMDQLGAALLLLALAPLFAVLAILIRRDGGDALFRHQRLGVNGRMFACMKFRSMVANSERVLEQLLESDMQAAAEWQATQKLRRDPRVTAVGRFLRKTSLDELPQLINVLRGEMSLVGPRPIVRAEIVRYGSEIRYYYRARPGLTGLWQVSGRSDTSYAQRVELDVRYVANWTFWRDIVIVLKTIPAVVLRKGAV